MSLLPFSSQGIIIVGTSKVESKKERKAHIKRMKELVDSAFSRNGNRKVGGKFSKVSS